MMNTRRLQRSIMFRFFDLSAVHGVLVNTELQVLAEQLVEFL